MTFNLFNGNIWFKTTSTHYIVQDEEVAADLTNKMNKQTINL